jgi:tRNA A-37 threonylcarbamoyl transferase component Bud32
LNTDAALQQAVAGRYEIGREIGHGGMAVVYLAKDLKLDRDVVIKVLRSELAHYEVARERFLREARVAARLSHPNVIRIFTVEEHGDLAFFVMEYVDGGTVKDAIRREGPLSPYRAAEILREVAWALEYAHGHGVVHRDVKPDNILLDRSTGRSLIGDFGIALVDQRHELTAEGMAVGTADYVSPEQAAGQDTDARSDIYSLGATAFFMLTGRPPFLASDDGKVLMMHRSEPPPSVASIRPEIPAPLTRVVDRCLQKEPPGRYSNSQSVADHLGEFLAGRQVVQPEIHSVVTATEQTLSRWAILAPISGIMVYALEGLQEFGVADLLLLLWVVWILIIELLLQPLALVSALRRIITAGTTYEEFRENVLADVAGRISETSRAPGPRPKHRLVLGLWAVSVATVSLVLVTTEAVAEGAQVGLRSLGVALVMVTIGLLGTFLISVWGVPTAYPLLRRTIWGGSFGRFLFKAAGWRLKGVRRSEVVGRPLFEQVLAARCTSILAELPPVDRRRLRDVSKTIARLRNEAAGLRQHLRVLNRALRQVRELAEDPVTEPTDETNGVDQGVAELQTGTEKEIVSQVDDTTNRLAAIRRELNTIRLGLIRVQTGSISADELRATHEPANP